MSSKVLCKRSFMGLAALLACVCPACGPVPEEVSYEGCAGDGSIEFPMFTSGPTLYTFPHFADEPISVAYEACTVDHSNFYIPEDEERPAFSDRIQILHDGAVIATHAVESAAGQVPGTDLGDGCYRVVHEFEDGLPPGDYVLRVHLDVFDEAVICEIEPDEIAKVQFVVTEPPPGGGPMDSPDDSDLPPLADAGANQIVRPLEMVTLDGSDSTDPDGGALSFAWAQLDGPSINLIDADAANPSFEAPLDTGIIQLELTVTDDEGDTDTDIVEIDVDQGTVLFVANRLGDSVLAFDAGKPPLLDGDLAPASVLAGNETAIDDPLGVLSDGAGTVLVLSGNGATGLATAAAFSTEGGLPGLDGEVPFLRLADLAELASGDALHWAGDAELGVIFATDASTQTIQVYDAACTEDFADIVSPARELSGSFVAGARGMHLDPAANLYVANVSSNQVQVFAGAQAADGFQVPARTVSSAAFTKPVEVLIDTEDRLYVVNAPNQVLVFEGASLAAGSLAPSRTITIAGAVDLVDLAIDSFGHAYVLDQGMGAIYGFDDFAALDGPVSPDRTIAGAGTQLSGPHSLHLVE